MSSRNSILADALVAALNGHTFSVDFTAERTFLVDMRAEEMDPATTYVHVVSAHDEPQQLGRGASTRVNDMSIDIGIRRKLQNFTDGKIDNTEVDAVIQLVEEISDFCGPETLGSLGWQKTEIPWLYVPDHLFRLGVVTSVVTVTFKQ